VFFLTIEEVLAGLAGDTSTFALITTRQET
jgi:hypothetical protein